MNLYNKFFFALLFVLPIISKGQVEPSIQNPYSIYSNYGVKLPFSSLRSLGMGGVGTAITNNQYLNFQNPALLSRNRMITHTVLHNETVGSISKIFSISEEELRDLNNIAEEVKEGQVLKIPTRKYTLWEAGLRFEVQNTKSSVSNQTDRNINFQYFAFSFPLAPRISIAGGLTPYSQQGLTQRTDWSAITGKPNSTYITRYDGNLNNAFLSAGYDISRNLSVGFQASYIFGNFRNENLLFSFDSTGTSNTGTIDQRSYSGLMFKPGLFYRTQINKAQGDSALFLGVGYTIDLHNRLFEENTQDIYAGQYLRTNRNIRYVSAIPATHNIGISLARADLWTLGADFMTSSYLNGEYRFALGSEWKFLGKRDKASVKVPTYRAGLYIHKHPYLVTFGDYEVKEYGLTLGGSFPIGKINTADKHQPLSKINLAIQTGLLGQTDVSPGRQAFLRLYAGILISDKWFRKRRIN